MITRCVQSHPALYASERFQTDHLEDIAFITNLSASTNLTDQGAKLAGGWE